MTTPDGPPIPVDGLAAIELVRDQLRALKAAEDGNPAPAGNVVRMIRTAAADPSKATDLIIGLTSVLASMFAQCAPEGTTGEEILDSFALAMMTDP